MKIWARIRGSLFPLATVGIVLIIWYAGVLIFNIPGYLLPLPQDVAQRIQQDFEFLLSHFWITSYETLGGFVLSIVIGIPIAFAIVASPTIDRALMPWLILSQTFPKVALAPLIIVWFGLGLFPKLIVTFLVAFFPIIISTVVGMRSIEREMLELGYSMRATKLQLFWHFRLPLALPNIFAGLKVAAAFAVVGAVIGEWVGANEGLGYLLILANANLDTSLLFAVLVMLMVLGVVLYYAIELIEHLVIPWHATIRLKGVSATM